jgi:hypothetical protein
MDKSPVSNEKKLTLLLLCWLFGLFGIHCFYSGKYFTGGLYLLTWGLSAVLGLLKNEVFAGIPIGLLFLWWLVDMMRIIMGRFTDRAGRRIVDWV